MKPAHPRWDRSLLPARTLASILALLVVLVAAASALGFWDAVENAVTAPALYRARVLLGREPAFGKGIKTLAWDDKTLTFVKHTYGTAGNDVPLAVWRELLAKVATARPRAVFVDRLFDGVLGLEDAPAFVAAVGALGVPVFCASRVADMRNPWKPETRRSSLETDLAAALPPLPVPAAGFHYGPDAAIEPAFAGIGHAVMTSPTAFEPFLRVAGAAIPHWALRLTAFGAKDEAKGLLALLPDASGRAQRIDYLSRAAVLPRIRSLSLIFAAMASGAPVPFVEPGDVVVILPGFYTGGTDIKTTPLGRMEGGLTQLSILNQVQRQAWIADGIAPTVAALAAVGLALLLGTILRVATFTAASAGLAAAVPALAAGAFAGLFAGSPVYLPFGSFLVAYVGGYVPILSLRLLREDLRSRLHRKDLELGAATQAYCMGAETRGRVGPVQFQIFTSPAAIMSGDWFQTYLADDAAPGAPRGVLAIGDVMGKGPSAALATATIASAWRAFFRERRGQLVAESSTELLTRLDQALFDAFGGRLCSTIQLAFVFDDRLEVLRCGAANWMHRPDGAPATIVRSPSIGMLGTTPERRAAVPRAVPLAAGGLFVAFTDGVIDGAATVERFRAAWETEGASGAAEVAALATRVGAASVMADDATFLGIWRQGAPDGMQSTGMSAALPTPNDSALTPPRN